MPDPIRILHFADLHIGMENYGRLDPDTGLNRRVVDFLDRLDGLVDYAIAHEADLVLFAGDAFRTRAPDPTHQREFAQRILRLSRAEIPTVLLVGNHDVPVMERRASSVEIFDALAVPHVTVAARPDVLRIKTRHGVLQLLTMPYPVRQRLLQREQFRQLGQEELDRAVTQAVVSLLEDLTGRCDPALPTVLTGHFSVESARWGSERSIMVGRDVGLPLAVLADPAWDYVALGHIHQHQELNSGQHPPIVYAGSLERVDFGEEKQPKGFCWVEVQRGHSAWRYIEVPARPFVTIRADVREADDPLAVIRERVAARDLDGAVARLVVQMTPEQEPLLRDSDIAPLLTAAFFAQINRDVTRTARDRLNGLSPDALTPEHLLERYLLAVGKAEADLPAYLAEAQGIFAEAESRG